jgi:hypothetical protein
MLLRTRVGITPRRGNGIFWEKIICERLAAKLRAAAFSPELSAQFYTRSLVPIEPVSSRCLISHSQYKLEEKLSIQFERQGGITHQLGGEPKMRFVSTALVMMAIALMLLALTLLPTTSGP